MFSGNLHIVVRCRTPKYIKGEYQFATFRDFLSWLAKIKALPKWSLGALLYGFVKSGYLNHVSGHYTFDAESNFSDYSLAQDLASKVGLLKIRMGSDSFSRKPEVALQFADELDKACHTGK